MNVWSITGAVTVAAGYYKIPVAYILGSLPTNGAALTVQFSRTGNQGSQGVQGAIGPGTALNSTAVTTNSTFYPVFVEGAGVQTPSIRTTATAFSFNPSTGNLTVGGTVTCTDLNSTSDANLKDNVENLSNSIDILKQINPVSFNWKDGGKKSYGVIAQELEKILPELVSRSSLNNHKTVSYIPLIAMLIDAVVELNKKVSKE